MRWSESARQIFENPELGYEEHFAHGLLTGFLREHGMNVTESAFDISTAFCASTGLCWARSGNHLR
ncbi:MAG: hypothetical protein R2735_09430 [Microthrixaceae bacterium]